jgi:hypothetical protein
VTLYGCRTCGLIFAPRNAPSACPGCAWGLAAMTLDEALDIARARQVRLRTSMPGASRPLRFDEPAGRQTGRPI